MGEIERVGVSVGEAVTVSTGVPEGEIVMDGVPEGSGKAEGVPLAEGVPVTTGVVGEETGAVVAAVASGVTWAFTVVCGAPANCTLLVMGDGLAG